MLGNNTVTITDYHLGDVVVDLSHGGDLICDIDGTIADIRHRRAHVQARPKDWPKFFAEMHLDQPIPDIIEAVLRIQNTRGWRVVFCTGRAWEHEAVTRDFLRRNMLRDDHLYMRQTRDRRADDIVKAEMLADMQNDGFNPTLALEDRTRVVKMWRSLTIKCIQVAKGDF